MILRVLTAIVKQERAGTFNDLMRKQLPMLREHEGLVWVKLARRIIGREEEVILVEEWRDAAALYGWTGPELDKARLLPGAEELVSDLRISHYEALDIEPYDI
ncbi:MAG: antibiotic biosynthesis monooxygenase [Candidatus Limnocylindrales bacterium]